MVNFRVTGVEEQYIDKLSDLQLIGFLRVLENNRDSELINLEALSGFYRVDFEEIKEMLLKAEDLKIIKSTTEFSGEQMIVNVKFLTQLKKNKIDNFTKAFGITEDQRKEVDKISKGDDGKLNEAIRKNNYSILFTRIKLPQSRRSVKLNSQEELIKY